LEAGTEEWQTFMDLADIVRGEIPKDVLGDEELLKKLPVFFRSVRGAELTGEQLDELIRMVKEAHTPGERKRKV
jgi:hypothetical protein